MKDAFMIQMKALDNRIKKTDILIGALSQQQLRVREERQALIAKMVLDEALLAEAPWTVQFNKETMHKFSGARFYLHAHKQAFPKLLARLKATGFGGWIDRSIRFGEYGKSAELKTDDNDLWLYFDKRGIGEKFIRKNKIKLDTSQEAEFRSRIEAELAELQAIMDFAAELAPGK